MMTFFKSLSVFLGLCVFTLGCQSIKPEPESRSAVDNRLEQEVKDVLGEVERLTTPQAAFQKDLETGLSHQEKRD